MKRLTDDSLNIIAEQNADAHDDGDGHGPMCEVCGACEATDIIRDVLVCERGVCRAQLPDPISARCQACGCPMDERSLTGLCADCAYELAAIAA